MDIFEATKVGLELLTVTRAIRDKKAVMQKMMIVLLAYNKKRTINLLRGYSCKDCRYLIPKHIVMPWNDSTSMPYVPDWIRDEKYEGTYHCVLRTDINARPTFRSEKKQFEGCKNYWKL